MSDIERELGVDRGRLVSAAWGYGADVGEGLLDTPVCDAVCRRLLQSCTCGEVFCCCLTSGLRLSHPTFVLPEP
jgi:hypothetical protein